MRNYPSEAETTRAIRGMLKSMQIFHWKVMQGLGSTPGVADIIGIYNGKPLAIEVKTKIGKLSEHQRKFGARWKMEGGIFIEARSVDDVIDGLGLRDRFIMPKKQAPGSN